jgi:hypothetical protein
METKDQIAAERDTLRDENARLKAQLAAAGRGGYQPSQRFQLSEGVRQELETYGVANINGVRMTREDVLGRLGDDQSGVDIAEPDAALDQREAVAARRTAPAVPGVDYVWPSVKPGQIDPAVAGTPGISGPAADPEDDTEDAGQGYDPAVDGE